MNRRYRAMSAGRTGTLASGGRSVRPRSASNWTSACADGGDDRRRHGDARRLAGALGPERRQRVRLLDQRRQHVGHVEERRQQVVREAGVADDTVDLHDLLHHRQAEALRDAALDLPDHGQRVERPADVLRRGHLDDLDESQLGVDVDDGAMGDEGERRVAVALAVLVQLLGRAVVELDGLVEGHAGSGGVDGAAPRVDLIDDLGSVDGQAVDVDPAFGGDVLEQPLAHRLTRRVHRAAAHPGLARSRRRPGRPDGGVDRVEQHDVDAEDAAGDLLGDGDEPLPNLRSRELQGRHPVDEPAARRGVVVEPLGVHEVLDRDTPPDATAHVTDVGGQPGTARQSHRIGISAHRGDADRRVGQRQRRRLSGCSGPPGPRSPPPDR